MTRSTFRILLLGVAVLCFVVAWGITADFPDSSWTNAAPWGYAGLGFGFGSFLL